MVAEWVMQVSFRPQLLAVAIENHARTLANINATGVFSVNVLPEDAMDLAAKFAQPYFGSKIRGRGLPAAAEVHRKLVGIPHRLGTTGCPLLHDALAWLECVVEQAVPVGDHTLVVGRADAGAVQQDADLLTSAITGWVHSG